MTISDRSQDSPLHRLTLDGLAVELRMMTPVEAASIIDTQVWEKQRTLRASHVQYLAGAIELGELSKLIVEFAEMPDGRLLLLDGQHRLHAIVRTGRELPCVLVVSRANSAKEVARIYAGIDRQKSRSIVDALRAYAVVTTGGIGPESLAKLTAGVAILMTGFSKDYSFQSRSLISRVDWLEALMPEVETYVWCIKGNSKEAWNILTRAAVVAVALATLRDVPDRAEQFWSGVATDDGLTRGDPRHTLLRWLRDTPVRAQSNAIVYAQYVAVAWNHWYAGTQTEKLIVRNKTAPIRLLGTKFTGRADDE